MTAAGADISICVAAYKQHDEPNLASLARSMPAALDGLDGELVVALNGITAAQAAAPADAVLVDLGVNRGVSKGWNAAAAAARGPVLCFANDDLDPGPRSLRLLHDAVASDREAGVVGPEGSLWDIAAGSHVEYVPVDGLAPGERREAHALSGFLFATRADTWERAGGFDETYTPCGFEEIDFCTTVRLRLGLANYVVGGVPTRHEFGISVHKPWARVNHNGRSEFLRTIMRRNRRYFMRKWQSA